MKSVLLFVWATVLALLMVLEVRAADDGTNLHVGNKKVSFLMGYSYSTVGGGVTYLDVNHQWFLTDRFALGPSLTYRGTQLSTLVGIGPAASWYFYSEKKLGVYLGEELTFNSFGNSNGSYLYSSTSLGLDYFIVPSVAFGPVVSFTKGFAANNVTFANPDGIWDFHLGLSIYL